MPAYVASARIARVMPRLANRDRVDEVRDEVAVVDVEATAGIDGPGDDSRWTAFRERWSQLTFFLLDGNSWR